MKYFIRRELNEYGPYTLADIQRYVAQGNILLTDLTRSEGMTEWVPVSQVIGNIPLAAPAVPSGQGIGTVYAGGTSYGGPSAGYGVAPAMAPVVSNPPGLHWGLLLLLEVITFGIFGVVWMIVQGVWVKKIRPDSSALLFWILGIGSFFVQGIIEGAAGKGNPLAVLLELAGVVLVQVGNFKMRSDLEEHYNSVEPIGLTLSGVMTFFFSFIYFQYHFTRINKWKKTGILTPQ